MPKPNTVALFVGPPSGRPILVVEDQALVDLVLLGLSHQLRTDRSGLTRPKRRSRRAE